MWSDRDSGGPITDSLRLSMTPPGSLAVCQARIGIQPLSENPAMKHFLQVRVTGHQRNFMHYKKEKKRPFAIAFNNGGDSTWKENAG
jgi:hypothetical protein